MKQIRIYYESLEQAENYIKPIIEKITDKEDVKIILVKRPKSERYLNSGSIAAILSMVTPDILITGVANNKEFPLILIEFSEAVTTEDHELQRTPGAIAAFLASAFYVKIAGEKYSEKEFGGAQYNPFSTPKIFIDEVISLLIGKQRKAINTLCNVIQNIRLALPTLQFSQPLCKMLCLLSCNLKKIGFQKV